TLAGAAGADDEDRSALGKIAAGGQFVHESTVELRETFEVELLEGLGGPEGGSPHAHLELLLLAAGDLIVDEEREKLGVGDLTLESLAVTGIEGVENTG